MYVSASFIDNALWISVYYACINLAVYNSIIFNTETYQLNLAQYHSYLDNIYPNPLKL